MTIEPDKRAHSGAMAGSGDSLSAVAQRDAPDKHAHVGTISRFEEILSTYPPILESLLAQLPTPAILDLYHTSRYLRDFLRAYPLAWRTLSFRMPQPPAPTGTPGNETPDSRDRQLRRYGFESLLQRVISPYGTRLTSLDLCNTSVSGITLINSVLAPRIHCLQHLSVRGCKSVSLKYHIVPFLEPYTIEGSPWDSKELALKSLYTYRCRHHRRRPYLPSSLARRDSDADPTHQLIEICHQLGIWTDTAWCPTPAGRCQRRKEYHDQRGGSLNKEIWVPFDRLWRSSNRFGPVDGEKELARDGRLWEIAETGQNGEPLGTEGTNCRGEGKHVPAHLRRSHKLFVHDIKCSQCKETILERCESCSIRMHCMGCRKTLCESCAFNRPIPRKRVKTRHFASLVFGSSTTLGSTLNQAASSSFSAQQSSPEDSNRFWWAPGATRSPNLMKESVNDDDSDDSDDGNMHAGMPLQHLNRNLPKLNMRWCCLEPIISGGGGIAVVGSGSGGRGADKIRAVPLPRRKEFEDPDFSHYVRTGDYVRELKHNGQLCDYYLKEDIDVLSYLKQDSLDLQAQSCPRSLCNDCYSTFRWKVSCRACKKPLCKEHDFRGLKFRKCGYRDMHTEREYAQTYEAEIESLVIPEFNPSRAASKESGIPAGTTTPTPRSTDLEPSDEAPLSQSQILLPTALPKIVPFPGNPNFKPSTGPSAGPSSLPFRPISSSRPRSFSASGVRNRQSGSWNINSPHNPITSITNPLPLPCNPRHPVQFEGCGAYFCQYPRPIGDNRTTCPATLKECSECAVLVCETCISSNPTCPCTYCTLNYHCPHCARKPAVQALCRLEEEIKAREEAKLRFQRSLEQEKRERYENDNVVGAAYEFWSLMGEVLEEVPDGATAYGEDHLEQLEQLALLQAEQAQTGQVGELVPSPDSITVTMEFGVSEELAGHSAVITAGGLMGGGPPSDVADDGQEEDGALENEQQNTPVAPAATPIVPVQEAAPPVPLHISPPPPPQQMPAEDPVEPAATSDPAVEEEPAGSSSAAEEEGEDSEDVENSDAGANAGEEAALEDGDAQFEGWDSDTERALFDQLFDEEFFA